VGESFNVDPVPVADPVPGIDERLQTSTLERNSGFWSVMMDSGLPTVVNAMNIGDMTLNQMTAAWLVGDLGDSVCTSVVCVGHVEVAFSSDDTVLDTPIEFPSVSVVAASAFVRVHADE